MNEPTSQKNIGSNQQSKQVRKRFRTQDSGEIYDSQENVDISEELGSNVTIVTKINYSEEQPSDGASSAPNNDYGKTNSTDPVEATREEEESGKKNRESKGVRKRFRMQDSGESYDNHDIVDISDEPASNAAIVKKTKYSEEQISEKASIAKSAPDDEYGKNKPASNETDARGTENSKEKTSDLDEENGESGERNGEWKRAALVKHNTLRALHDSPPLVLVSKVYLKQI